MAVSKRTLAAGTLIALALALTPQAASASLDTIAGIGAWCWFQDPRAVEFNGKTVFGWVGENGETMVGDDQGRTFTLMSSLPQDDHNNPAFYERLDGRLTAFWSGHQADTMYQRTTIGSDITRWGPISELPANSDGTRRYTYPAPIRSGDRLFLFWSGTSNDAATYSISNDDGDTWSDARLLFKAEGRTPSENRIRYVKYAAGVDGSIHMAWVVNHPTFIRSPLYHAVIRPGGSIERQDGTRIGELGEPVDPWAGDVVYQPSLPAGACERCLGGAWVHDLAVVGDTPTIGYATFPSFENHEYRYATWDGADWSDEHVVDAGPTFESSGIDGGQPYYSGGITLDPDAPSVAYLSRQVGGEFEVERWAREADGWAYEAITADSDVSNVRPFPVDGGVAWMRGEYPRYWSFDTALVWLPPGAPVPIRPAGEAEPTEEHAPTVPPVTGGTQSPMRPHVPLPATTAPPVSSSHSPDRASARKRPCARPLKGWRSEHRLVHLRRYWVCRARRGQCRAVRRHVRHSNAAKRVYERRCRRAMSRRG